MVDKKTMKALIEKDWNENPRWKGIKRPYTADEVVNLKGSVNIEHTLAKKGANKFWDLLNNDTNGSESLVFAQPDEDGNNGSENVLGLVSGANVYVANTRENGARNGLYGSNS